MSPDGNVDPEDVEAYVATVRSAIESDPSMSARTAELRVTQPLLELLGWDLHDGAVVAGYDTDAGTVGYALCPGERPRAFVDTAAPSNGLTPDDGETLLAAMESAGVDRGLLTDGHTLAVVRLTDDGRVHERFDLDELADNVGALARVTRDALDDERAVAARRLRRDAETVATALTDDLLEATEGHCEDELRSAVDTFLERLVESLEAPAGANRSAAAASVPASESASAPEPSSTSTEGTADAADPEPPVEDDDETASPAADDGATADDGPDGAEAEPGSGNAQVTADPDGSAAAVERGADASADEGGDSEREFVVRLFDGRSSVGAVGGSAPLSALLQTAELLERQRALLRGLETPWAPDDDARVVLTDEPVGDGPTRQLPTGHYLATDLDEAEARTAVEGLASAAGLRVMFQGDWPER